jgi:hypothetical protein
MLDCFDHFDDGRSNASHQPRTPVSCSRGHNEWLDEELDREVGSTPDHTVRRFDGGGLGQATVERPHSTSM